MAGPNSTQERRLIRILDALHGNNPHKAYLSNAGLREDLRREAAYGESNEADAFVLPEDLEFFNDQMQATLNTLRDPLRQQMPTLTPGPDQADQDTTKGPVIIVPGGAMTELNDVGPKRPEGIWIRPAALIRGRFYDLPLRHYAGPNAEIDLWAPSVQINACRPVPFLYASLASKLRADGWATYPFPYDWRKHVDHPANVGNLIDWIKKLAAGGLPVNLVTHSQGGVVARKALSEMIRTKVPDMEKILGRVVQLGPANHGAFVMSLLAAGSFREIPLVRRLLGIKPRKTQRVTKTFTPFYQIMPYDQNLVPSLGTSDVRDPAFWKGLLHRGIDFDRLEVAFPTGGIPWAQQIDTGSICDRITVIVGSVTSEQTAGGVGFDGKGRLVVDHGYGLPGDGWVPDKLAILATSGAYRAARVGHIRLPLAPKVIEGVRQILNRPVVAGGNCGPVPDLDQLQ